MAIRVGRVERRSSAGHHGLAGALHHTPNAALLHSNNQQRMVRRNGAGVACLSTLHTSRRILLCAAGVCPGVRHGRPTLHPALLVIRPPCLLDKCSTQKGGGALKEARDKLEARVEERTSELRRASEGLEAEIAERKRGEDILRERANLLDLTHDTVFVRDANNVITFWNRGAERLYGWTREEAVGQVSHHLMQTIFPAPLEKITAELNSTGRWEGELIHARRDGTQVVVASRWALQLDERGKPIAVLETNNDITERKRAEEALHRAQTELAHVTRVATLGEMTASIAHEVNQPLGAVVNNASACLRWLAGQAPNLEEARQSATLIIADGHRASEIIGRIRALVKKSPPRKDWLDINETYT